MVSPPPLLLARQIAPLLDGVHWGIGGSLLLWRLGLEANPRDLDIMTTAAHFPLAYQRIGEKLGDGVRTPHPSFKSMHFAKFNADGAVSIDLFAEVRVTNNDTTSWRFDPEGVEFWQGLPWMLPSAWLELYTLFDRPERVNALRTYLRSTPHAREDDR